MVLNKTYNRSAKWDIEKYQWRVRETNLYQWYTNEEKPASPIYYEFSEALQWIIQHDQHDENLS
jgi:hypothetical protein